MSLSHGKKLSVMYKVFPHKKAAKYYEKIHLKDHISKNLEEFMKANTDMK